MPKCNQCSVDFPITIVIDGKQRNLSNRKLCLDCKPYQERIFGHHNMEPVKCSNCKQETLKWPCEIRRNGHNYCSQRCHHKAPPVKTSAKREKGREVGKQCINCGEARLSGKKYCSLECMRQHRYNNYIAKWKAGEIDGSIRDGLGTSDTIRHYLFVKYGNKCAKCGWCKINSTTGKIPLHVEHIDGNWKDNSEANLILLCPNCHALTSTYRSLNRGNGRYTIRRAMRKL